MEAAVLRCDGELAMRKGDNERAEECFIRSKDWPLLEMLYLTSGQHDKLAAIINDINFSAPNELGRQLSNSTNVPNLASPKTVVRQPSMESERYEADFEEEEEGPAPAPARQHTGDSEQSALCWFLLGARTGRKVEMAR